jgi:hypothetical protein
MSLLLRMVGNLNRLKAHPNQDWLQASDVPSIMIKEFTPRCPEERGLSVWNVDEDLSNLRDIIAAIALTPKRKSLPPHSIYFFQGN